MKKLIGAIKNLQLVVTASSLIHHAVDVVCTIEQCIFDCSLAAEGSYVTTTLIPAINDTHTTICSYNGSFQQKITLISPCVCLCVGEGGL